MSQKRFTDFGAFRSSELLNNIVQSLTQASVLKGGGFSVAGPDSLRIEPVTLVMPTGVIVEEDEPVFVNIQNTTTPVNYTLYYTHIQEKVLGGNKALFIVSVGLLKQEDLADSVVLGYVQYPGGNVPIEKNQFSEPKNVSLSSVQSPGFDGNTLLPPFELKTVNVSGIGITTISTLFDSGVSFTRYQNNDNIFVDSIKLLPGLVFDRQPRSVLVLARADFGASVKVSVLGNTGTEFMLANNNINNTSTEFSLFTMSLAEAPGDFSVNRQFNIKLDFNIGVGKKVDIAAIGYTEFNLPF